ncbi:GTP cyclohydrolase 1 feedback regulatory protein-like isoform X4 [Physella acuta]|uniref:GTP cyclohydrolase 1 feedback regulatory protein-like isoform X4 n=1 Tax=Physella acuta TaxID=109671 RepID=UPI0027DCFCB8|nr:GTP cyclohydrolase 1 feedback regulatory protein-like isoform X4 [Physella acuta]
MPYVIISTQIRLDVGPTVVGDEWSDRELMEYLDATLIKQLGNNYSAQYRTEAAPRVVLEKLEKRGYKLVAMTGVGQTCIWTLHKEISDSEKALSSSSSDAFESPKIESRVALPGSLMHIILTFCDYCKRWPVCLRRSLLDKA